MKDTVFLNKIRIAYKSNTGVVKPKPVPKAKQKTHAKSQLAKALSN